MREIKRPLLLLAAAVMAFGLLGAVFVFAA
jgi:hypothetical protein